MFIKKSIPVSEINELMGTYILRCCYVSTNMYSQQCRKNAVPSCGRRSNTPEVGTKSTGSDVHAGELMNLYVHVKYHYLKS